MAENQRQYFAFTFYRARPEWRRLSADEKTAMAEEFTAALRSGGERVEVRPFATQGLKQDSDFFLWFVSRDLADLQSLAVDLYQTALAPWLEVTHNYLSMTKPSPYGGSPEGSRPYSKSAANYLFIYPFVKTRDWWALPIEERRRMMKAHIEMGAGFPSVRINTSYSFGLDDQEFVVAFESDQPADFLDLVQKLRETEASRYTLRDTPMFVGVATPLEDLMRQISGRPGTLSLKR